MALTKAHSRMIEGAAVNVVDFGAVGDGVTDDAAAFNAATSVVEAIGGTVFIPSGKYMLKSQWGVKAEGNQARVRIEGYGAELFTEGAISAIQIESGSGNVNSGVSIFGVKINHRGNANATYGIEILGAWNTRIYECTVEAHGTNSNYASFRVADATGGVGSFWTKFVNCWTRKRSGADVGDIPVGISIEGNSNATTVMGCGLNNCDAGVKITDQGDTDTPNAVLITDTAFEYCTDAIYLGTTTSTSIVGLRVIGCRGEVLTNFLNYQMSVESSQPPVLIGNMLVSSLTNYILNPNNLRYVSYDISTTPRINPTLKQSGPLTLEVGSNAEEGLILKQNSGTESGVKFELLSGAELFKCGYTSSGRFTFEPNVSGGVRAQYNGVRGISNTSTAAENLRGSVVLSGGSATVSFSPAEPNSSYYIVATANATEAISVTSKTTSGFTLTSSNGSSTASVDWILIR